MAKQPSLYHFFGNKEKEKEKCSQEESKKRYELKRKRGFVDSWKIEFDGLIDSENGMICTVCQKYNGMSGATSFLTGNTTYRIDSVRSHFSSPKHLQCAAALHTEQKKAANEVKCIFLIFPLTHC